MPFLVKTELRTSQVDGRGVFLLQDIPKGTAYWAYSSQKSVPIAGLEEKPNVAYTQQHFKQLPAQQIRRILDHGYYAKKRDIMVDLQDGWSFCNHVQNFPSVYVDEVGDIRQSYSVTTQDLKKGDELADDYRQDCPYPQWLITMYKQYSPKGYKFVTSILGQKLKAFS